VACVLLVGGVLAEGCGTQTRSRDPGRRHRSAQARRDAWSHRCRGIGGKGSRECDGCRRGIPGSSCTPGRASARRHASRERHPGEWLQLDLSRTQSDRTFREVHVTHNGRGDLCVRTPGQGEFDGGGAEVVARIEPP
jgi:hypothetical protein